MDDLFVAFGRWMQELPRGKMLKEFPLTMVGISSHEANERGRWHFWCIMVHGGQLRRSVWIFYDFMAFIQGEASEIF